MCTSVRTVLAFSSEDIRLFFFAYLHNGLEVDHGLPWTPVVPVPLITLMGLETDHPLHLESVSQQGMSEETLTAAIKALI